MNKQVHVTSLHCEETHDILEHHRFVVRVARKVDGGARVSLSRQTDGAETLYFARDGDGMDGLAFALLVELTKKYAQEYVAWVMGFTRSRPRMEDLEAAADFLRLSRPVPLTFAEMSQVIRLSRAL